MSQVERGEDLIREMLANPRKFEDEDRAYDLLQAYFRGLPLDTLRPLLTHQDVFVQRGASFIAGELGIKARPLVNEVVPLISSTDPHVRSSAMEVLTVCGEGEHAEKFALVVGELESDHPGLRQEAMHLVANADVQQLEAALRVFTDRGDDVHQRGLRTLAMGDQLDPATVTSMLRDTSPLIRRYAAVAAKRLLPRFPDLIREAASSDDPDLREFSRWVTRIAAARSGTLPDE